MNLIDISYSFLRQISPEPSSKSLEPEKEPGQEQIDMSRFFTTCGRFLGELRIPATVYQGDQFTVALDLQGPEFRKIGGQERGARSLVVPLYSSKKLEQVYRLLAKLQSKEGFSEEDIPAEQDGANRFLEAELSAEGLEMQGENVQRELFMPDLEKARTSYLSYRWRCRFPAAGNHSVKVVLRLLADGESPRLGEVNHQVSTTRLGKLEKGQVLGLSILLCLAALGLALAAAWELAA
ncbi:MAG: hypothetical protein GKC10_07675 [Methanosarcinales archaeon]|nr:hypothetical protein [Methanosarcinales archaeon]